MKSTPRPRWTRVEIGDVGWAVPEVPGVYVGICNGVILYVGTTINLRSRLMDHSCKRNWEHALGSTRWVKRRGAYVKYRHARKFGEQLMAEARLIRRLKPEFNRAASSPYGQTAGRS